jgi:hypothetical protein
VVSGASEATASKAADAVAAAHQKLLNDHGLQFDFSVVTPLELPSWLVRFFDFLSSMRPLFEILFWWGVVVLAGLVLYFVIREIVRYRGRERAVVQQAPDYAADFRPPPARALALLADADLLAAQGRYVEAVHLLLFRSIDDIDERRPRTLTPALTSRDIATIAALPASARYAFARIAASVERSFFGRSDVSAEDFAECRRAYEAFALPEAWGQHGAAVSQLRRLTPA